MNGDILDQLAQDARRLRVARKLPDGPLSWDWIQRVQADYEAFLDAEGLSQVKIAKSLGVSAGTLSSFRNMAREDEYIGDRDKIARALNEYMERYARGKEVPRPDGLVSTQVAERMLSLIRNTISMRSIGLIYSDAGRGKTMVLKAANQLFHGSLYIRVRSTTRSVTGLANQLKSVAKVRCARSTRAIQDAIIDLLKGTDRPIFVDEAHQLSSDALEFLRDLHDECEVPIVLAGTKLIADKCSDNDAFFGQFTSRTALTYDVTREAMEAKSPTDPGATLHSVAEIRKIFERGTLRLTNDGADAAMRLANILGLGGLRLVEKVMFAAAAVASGKRVDARLIRRVLVQMHNGAPVCQAMAQAVQPERRAKSA